MAKISLRNKTTVKVLQKNFCRQKLNQWPKLSIFTNDIFLVWSQSIYIFWNCQKVIGLWLKKFLLESLSKVRGAILPPPLGLIGLNSPWVLRQESSLKIGKCNWELLSVFEIVSAFEQWSIIFVARIQHLQRA